MNEIFWVVKHCLIASTKSTVILKNEILSKIYQTLEAELIRKNNKQSVQDIVVKMINMSGISDILLHKRL